MYNLWGGEKLSKLYKKEPNQYGEAWIMSCLEDNNSNIDGTSLTLKDLFNQNPNIVRKGYKGDFPLLIKLIDAKQDLSIQVHPNIKTESWHILSNVPSRLYIGFKENTSRNEIEKELISGDITTKLNRVIANKEDTFLIKPGTIHTIGEGTFLIEVQSSANITYRLYDFHRLDKNGHERKLHIKEALDVIDYNKVNAKQVRKGNLIVECNHFKVYRFDINGKHVNEVNDSSFHSIVVISGEGTIKMQDEFISIKAGDSLFIPAGEGKYIIDGNLSIITTTL